MLEVLTALNEENYGVVVELCERCREPRAQFIIMTYGVWAGDNVLNGTKPTNFWNLRCVFCRQEREYERSRYVRALAAVQARQMSTEQGLAETNPSLHRVWRLLSPPARTEVPGYRNPAGSEFVGYHDCLQMLRELALAGHDVDAICREIDDWKSAPQYRLDALPGEVRAYWWSKGSPGAQFVTSPFAWNRGPAGVA